MDAVEQIKYRLSIEDVVSGYVELIRAGQNLKARCPFHNEKTPSFFVSPARGTYHCFGCKAGGDIFEFVQNIEGLDFLGALKMLGERVGVDIAQSRGDNKDKKSRLFSAVEKAALFYTNELSKKKEALNYLEKRGLKYDTIKSFRLGYAENSWRTLYTHMKGGGYSEKELEDVGLIKRKEGGSGYYDCFRGRIMFPIADSAGRIVAFSGRKFPDDGNHESGAKYINSKETGIFNKSNILFGFDRAKLTIRSLNCSIIVEGQMDLLMCHQAGYANTVALSGTALSAQQCLILKRMSDNVVLALDADLAGQSAVERSAYEAIPLNMDVKVAALDEGEDPSEMIKKSVEHWRKVVKNAKHVVEYFLDTIENRGYEPRKFKKEAVLRILPFVALIKSGVDKAHFVSLIARRVDVNEEIIWEELKNIKPFVTSNTNLEKSSTKISSHESVSRKAALQKELASIVLWQNSLKVPMVSIANLESKISSLVDINAFSKKEALVFEAEERYGQTANLEKEIEVLVFSLEKEGIREKYHMAVCELKEAEKEGDRERINKAAELCAQLSRKLF